jgi:hypothetical protein
LFALFGVSNRYNHLAKKPEGNEPLLGIGKTIILIRVDHALEYLFRIDKIESMLLKSLVDCIYF